MTLADEIQQAKSVDGVLNVLAPTFVRLDILPVELVELLPLVSAQVSSDSVDPAFFKRQLGLSQLALLDKWTEIDLGLSEQEREILTAFFVPRHGRNETRCQLALSALDILSASMTTTSDVHEDKVRRAGGLLESLFVTFSLSTLAHHIFFATTSSARDSHVAALRWSALLDTYSRLPDRVANVYGLAGHVRDIPANLTRAGLATYMTTALLDIVADSDLPLPACQAIVERMPPRPTEGADFWARALPFLIDLAAPLPFPTPADQLVDRRRVVQRWQGLFEEIAPSLATGFVASFLRQTLPLAHSHESQAALARVLGTTFSSTTESVRASVIKAALSHEPSDELANILAIYATSAGDEPLANTFDTVARKWCDTQNLKRSTASQRAYETRLLLLLLLLLPVRHPTVRTLSFSRSFLNAISESMSQLDQHKRFLGLLVAELVSERSVDEGVQPLCFGDVWDGKGDARPSVKDLRASVLAFKIPDPATLSDALHSLRVSLANAHLTPVLSKRPLRAATATTTAQSATVVNGNEKQKKPLIQVIEPVEEDLQPYAMPAAPSDAYLETLSSDDPSLYASAMPSTNDSSTRRKGRIRPPVYILELIAYINGTQEQKAEEDEKADRIEIALQNGEDLVRRKKGWGTELDDNAVTLAYAVANLKDDYEIDRFDEMRQSILTALVACAPTKAAPALIEQFFSDHLSISQLVSTLSAIALGALELAGQKAVPEQQFASSRLPDRAHTKLLPQENKTSIDTLTEQMMAQTISGVKQDAEQSIPEARREKLLTVKRFKSASSPVSTAKTCPFTDIAAEFFLLPLINRFWTYLRDSAARSTSKGSYAGGTVTTVLNPIVLTQYFGTLAVLTNAARNSPHFAGVIARETIELVMAFRMTETEVEVLAAELELVVVTLDGAFAIDKGRTTLRSMPNGIEIMQELRDWANAVFEAEERRRQRGGGAISRAGRASAAILLRLEDLVHF